jgi:radical SAM superfamily enzyme YgiQ (UPF0313 family)
LRYVPRVYRPPSEADAFILQATLGCSWNHCTYCDMYRDKPFRVRALDEVLEDLDTASAVAGDRITKLFVADGDALVMDLDHWLPLLERAAELLPRCRRVSCYAMASNVLAKTDAELVALRQAGLSRLYIGPESGDPATLKRIAKGSSFDDHVEAARRAKAAGMELSVIVLLGVAGVERSLEHARATAALVTAMDPEFLGALTTTVVPGTPLARLQETDRFELPDVRGLLAELRVLVDEARPTDTLFRTNHASNYLPLGGRLPADRERIVGVIDSALAGGTALRPEWSRGL